jgi:hypothetical protein
VGARGMSTYRSAENRAPLEVIHILGDGAVGGGSTVVLQLAAGLQHRGAKVTVAGPVGVLPASQGGHDLKSGTTAVTTPSAGIFVASMPKSSERCWTNMSNSSNESWSSKSSICARRVSFPSACSAEMRLPGGLAGGGCRGCFTAEQGSRTYPRAHSAPRRRRNGRALRDLGEGGVLAGRSREAFHRSQLAFISIVDGVIFPTRISSLCSSCLCGPRPLPRESAASFSAFLPLRHDPDASSSDTTK